MGQKGATMNYMHSVIIILCATISYLHPMQDDKMHIVQVLYTFNRAIEKDDFEMVKKMITQHKSLIRNFKTTPNNDPLCLAIASPLEHANDIAQELINRCIRCKRKRPWRTTYMHFAAEHNKPEVIIALYKKGVCLNIEDKLYNTPLHIAAKNGYTDLVEMLLTMGADSHHLNEWLQTPLHCAAASKNHEIIQLLIEHKGDMFQKDQFGITAYDMLKF